MPVEPAPLTAVYVSNADSGDIWVYHLDPGGTLTPVQRMMIGGMVMPLALSHDHTRLYAARRSDPLEVVSYAIDPQTGELSTLGEAPLPASMAYLSTDRTGRWWFAASYGANLIAVGPIDADGIAHAATQQVATGPHAHAIVVDPSNRLVLATTLGDGRLLQFRFDAERGSLSPADPPFLVPHAGASPRHVVFDRDARHAYLLNELDARLDVLAFDAGTCRTLQTLDTLPPGFDGTPWASDLHLTPDGRTLYTSERNSSTLARFSVDPGTGRLTPLGHVPTEAEPRGFAITPDGWWLVAAGQASHQLSVHALSDAAPRRCGSTPTGRNPNWIEVVTLRG